MRRSLIPALALAALVLLVALVGCAGPVAYRPPSNLTDETGATVVLGSAAQFERGTSWDTYLVDVSIEIYRLDLGCPDNGRRSPGYLGTVTLPKKSKAEFIVPAGRRIALSASWMQRGLFQSGTCYTVLAFNPDRASAYAYVYRAPTSDVPCCGASIREIVTGADGKDRTEPVDGAIYPRLVRTFWGDEAPELCDRGQIH
jgi:hypothetical protein